MLSSFLGIFGQRANLTQTTYISDHPELFDMMTFDQQKVKNVRFINDEPIQLDWVYNEDFIAASTKTNVVIAAYTTAQARVTLYSYLKHLGECVLHCDTDSVVCTTAPGQWDLPLRDYLEDYLGDLTDKWPKKLCILIAKCKQRRTILYL